MSETPTIPDWLVPGAKVVLYSTGGTGQQRHVRVTTVAKIAKRTFTVTEEREPRFSVEKLSASAGDWGRTRHVTPYGSDQARAEIEGARQRNLAYEARSATEQWQKERTQENRLAAIKALQAVEVDEDPS